MRRRTWRAPRWMTASTANSPKTRMIASVSTMSALTQGIVARSSSLSTRRGRLGWRARSSATGDQPRARAPLRTQAPMHPSAPVTRTRSPSSAIAEALPGSAGRRAVVPALDQILGGLDGYGCVAAIGVGADRLAEFLVQRRTADQHDVVVADALLLHRVDDHLH